MNTIPSIFNERIISYTVLGGAQEPAKILLADITCVVLVRSGRHYRTRVFENLVGLGFEKIISAESNSGQILTEQLVKQFPSVRFIIPQEKVSQCDLLNIAMAEAKTKFVLVLQEEVCGEKISFSPSLAASLKEKNKFCVCPRLFSSSMEKLPVVYSPAVEKSVFKIDSDISYSDGDPTFYSADLSGLYDREKFIFLGGFDYTISSSYWQKVDLFFRSWLWGEETVLSSAFELMYTDEIIVEDQTVDFSYLRFYLKNLVPVFNNDHAKIKASSFLSFHSRSSCGVVESYRQFRDAIRWVNENRYRFKKDAAVLIETWKQGE